MNNKVPDRFLIGSKKIYCSRTQIGPNALITQFFKKVGKNYFPISIKIPENIFQYIISDMFKFYDIKDNKRTIKYGLEVYKYLIGLTQEDLDLININIKLGGGVT